MNIRKLLFPLFLGSSTFSIMSLGAIKPAHAWFNVCNQSSKKAHVAFAYYNVTDNRSRPAPVAGGSAWTSEGWWTLTPGQCVQVYPHELWRRNRYYYVYAESDSRTTWGGNKTFCVARGSAFRLMQADLPINTAPSGQAINGCAGGRVSENQIERVGFDEVEIRGRTQNFTYRLND